MEKQGKFERSAKTILGFERFLSKLRDMEKNCLLMSAYTGYQTNTYHICCMFYGNFDSPTSFAEKYLSKSERNPYNFLQCPGILDQQKQYLDHHLNQEDKIQ